MNRWCREILRLPRPLANARLSVADSRKGPAGPKRGVTIKELQRRAFERGRAVEREESAGLVRAISQRLDEAVVRHLEGLRQDREQIEEFAVKLALLVARKAVKTSLDSEGVDVGVLVNDALSEIDFSARKGGVTVQLHPSDHTLLLPIIAAGEWDPREVIFEENASLNRGDVRITAGHAEFYSSVMERLCELERELTREAKHEQA